MKTIDKKKNQVVKLLNEIQDLKYKELLKTFTKTFEKEINVGSKKEPHMVIAKYGCWYEWFKDEEKPNEKGVKIERKTIFEVDGQRIGFDYFTVKNLGL